MWLNTPRRPYEACGTSGMKVVPNGGLNLSVLDGWWAEAYRPGVGWAIGDGQEFVHAGYQDEVDAESLYSLLEQRSGAPLLRPRRRRTAPGLDRHDEELHPGAGRRPSRGPHGQAVRRALLRARRPTATSAWPPTTSPRPRSSPPGGPGCATAWCDVRVTWVEERGTPEVTVGDAIEVAAKVRLGSLEPADVVVEAYVSVCGPTAPCATAAAPRSTGWAARTASTSTGARCPADLRSARLRGAGPALPRRRPGAQRAAAHRLGGSRLD